jgi:hypothetical protein
LPLEIDDYHHGCSQVWAWPVKQNQEAKYWTIILSTTAKHYQSSNQQQPIFYFDSSHL